MSNNILTASTNRCFLAAGRQRILNIGSDDPTVSHRISGQFALHHLMGVVSEGYQTYSWFTRQNCEETREAVVSFKTPGM